jgi:hypothetical protein
MAFRLCRFHHPPSPNYRLWTFRPGCLFRLVTCHLSLVTHEVRSFCAVTGNTLTGFSAGCQARCKSLIDGGIQLTDLCN